MRIVIDLQGAQSSGSRNRGIGRYTTSFIKEFVRQKDVNDELLIVLNGLLVESIKPIIQEFAGLLPEENFRVWSSLPKVNHHDPKCDGNREIAESIRERFIADLNPDLILVTSLFEGGDDSVVTVKNHVLGIPTAVVLYDLIPYIYKDIYLQNVNVKNWYYEKIKQLRRSDLLLSISESSGQEAINYLGFRTADVVNISTACHDHFTPRLNNEKNNVDVLSNFGLTSDYIMYTGGIDHRKNIEGLIESFSILPKNVLQKYKLAIVCKVNEHDKARLNSFVAKLGLSHDSVIFTGFVSEEDLVELYRSCSLFVFPSWHEGFGLPALEAMSCGKAVVGSNSSSIPEVLGRSDLLFDPYNTEDIANKILYVLTNDNVRAEIEAYSLQRAKLFSWSSSAAIAWSAIRARFDKASKSTKPLTRKKLAILSPLPPAKSGISEYTATLMEDLSVFYDIELFIADPDSKPLAGFDSYNLEYFRANCNKYDRVLYHIGNSAFHSNILELSKEIPGVIVLHDFFLSGVLHHLEALKIKDNIWSDEILESHGFGALKVRSDVKTWHDAMIEWPSNYSYLKYAVGVIVHSEFSCELARKFYKNDIERKFRISPMVRKLKNNSLKKNDARKKLGFKDSDFIICSFGIIDHTKCNQKIIEAISKSDLSKMDSVKLVMVGESPNSVFKNELLTQIRSVRGNIKIEITGWVSEEVYEQFLIASDVAVQLRINSRGETSAAVHDALLYGIPLIVNDYASFSYFSDKEVVKISAEFTVEELSSAIERLYHNSALRQDLSEFLANKYPELLSPRNCANILFNNVEDCYRVYEQGLGGVLGDLPKITQTLDTASKVELVRHIESNFFQKANPKEFWVLSKERESTFSNDIIEHYIATCSLDSLELAFSGKQLSYADDIFHRILSLPKFSNERGVVNFSEFDRVIISASNVTSASFVSSFEYLLFALSHNVKIYIFIDDVSFLNEVFDIIVGDDAYLVTFKKIISLTHKLLFSDLDYLNYFYSLNECLGLRDEMLPTSALVNISDGNRASAVLQAITTDSKDFVLSNPNSLMYFTGSDKRFSSQVGERVGRSIFTTANQGFLLFGPYASLAAGSYDIKMSLCCNNLSPSDFLDVACDSGCLQLAHLLLTEHLNEEVSSLKLSIALDHGISDLEIRIYCGAESIIRIDEIVIQKSVPNIVQNTQDSSSIEEDSSCQEFSADVSGSALLKAVPSKKPFHGSKAKPNKRRKR